MSRGFTVIELLVTIGIMAVITGTVLGNYPQFSRRLNIERETQIVALSLREAEERAIRTQRAGGGFQAPFGVHFDLASPKQYIFFADTGGVSDFYDTGEELEVISMGRDVRLDHICKHEKNILLGVDCGISSLSVTFRRPAPLIEIHGVSGGPIEDLGEPDFEIYVKTEDGSLSQTIVVWTTGAISIEN